MGLTAVSRIGEGRFDVPAQVCIPEDDPAGLLSNRFAGFIFISWRFVRQRTFAFRLFFSLDEQSYTEVRFSLVLQC
jgi:hypothetical protein